MVYNFYEAEPQPVAEATSHENKEKPLKACGSAYISESYPVLRGKGNHGAYLPSHLHP